MRRRYFKAQSGRFYRNTRLIMSEREIFLNRVLLWRRKKLQQEWNEVFREGVKYVDEIRLRDKVVQRQSFREAYPDNPGLWQLDEPEED